MGDLPGGKLAYLLAQQVQIRWLALDQQQQHRNDDEDQRQKAGLLHGSPLVLRANAPDGDLQAAIW